MRREVIRFRAAAGAGLLLLALFVACGVTSQRSPSLNLHARPTNRTCTAPPRPTAPVRVVRAFPNAMFEQPTSVAASGDHQWWFVAERRGRIFRLAANDDGARPELVLDISDRVNASTPAIGVLALAVHPTNGTLFVSYTGNGGTLATSVISRFPLIDGGPQRDASREQRLLELDQISDYHVNADMQFGPDGYLYVGFGDGGPHYDPLHRAQDPYSLKGKILRLDVESSASYRIPSDNPFAQSGGRPEVWALGLRNPWRFGFDRETGDLWAGDVGQDRAEEIDHIVRGGNYGWAVREADRCVAPPTCTGPNLIEPLVALPHPEVSSVTFAAVYRGSAIPSLVGKVIYADFASGALWQVDPTATKPKPKMINSDGHAAVAFAEDAGGELLLVDLRGTLWRVEPGASGPADMPAQLSATGCFERSGTPSAGLIPYEINLSFWSDGAGKRRWFAIPDGTKIAIDDEGHLDFPVGSVIAKEFTIENVRVETRLFVRHDDGEWAGYSYRWNPTQTDATLIPTSANGTTATAPHRWYFPHRGECIRCHNAEAGHVLGLELRQLHRPVELDGHSIDQVAAFARVGLFANPPPPIQALPTTHTSSTEQRARTWLHVNCAYCHRPGGTGLGDMDLRITTPLADTGLCKDARDGTFGIVGARRITPGNPRLSMVSRRIHATSFIRMPPLGSFNVDPDGSAVVDQWIREIRCP